MAGNDAPRAAPDAYRTPGPEAAARVLVLLREMQVWLLAGYAADAVIRAVSVVEIALRMLSGMRPDAGAELGALIDELRRSGRTALLADASWLYQVRITIESFAGQVRAERDADARRASQIAIRLARDTGLVTDSQVIDCETAAAWLASEPASNTLLRLDRAHHRTALDDGLARSRRVLAVLVHGEVGQGHDHFAEIMTWRLRSA